MKTLLAVLLLSGMALAQSISNPGGASTNPTSGVEPVKCTATTFCDSPVTVSPASTAGSSTVQPTADVVPWIVKCVSGGAADCFQVFGQAGTKNFWIDASGNVNFSGNALALGSTASSTASNFALFGSQAAANAGAPYIKLVPSPSASGVPSYLFPGSVGGTIGISNNAVPSADVTSAQQVLTGSANQLANNQDVWLSKRFTDSAQTGNYIHFQNAAGNLDTFRVDVTGNLFLGSAAAGIQHTTGGVVAYNAALNNGGAATWFNYNTANGNWGDGGTYAQQFFKISPTYNPVVATNTMSNTFLEVGGSFVPASAETVNGAAQWLGETIDPTFGNSNTTYNGAASAPIVGLQISPTINVLAASTGTYDALKINPTESSVGTGTFGSLAHFQVGGSDRMKVFSGGHIDLNQGTAPTITAACGTSPSIIANSTDNSFRIQVGTGGVATSCTVTFNKPFKAADGSTAKIPACTANSESAVIALQAAPTTSTVVVTAAAAFAASSVLGVHCW